MSENNGGSMMVGFLLGAVVGAGVALLLAPTSGDETRRRISETASKLKDRSKSRLDDVKDMIKDGAGEFGAAIDAGKEAFRRNAESAPMSRDRG